MTGTTSCLSIRQNVLEPHQRREVVGNLLVERLVLWSHAVQGKGVGVVGFFYGDW